MTTRSRSHASSFAWLLVACLGIAGWAACGATAPQPEAPKTPEPAASSPAPVESSPAPAASTPAPAPQPEPVASASAAAPTPAPLSGFTPIPAEAKGKYPGGTIAKARMFDLSGGCPEPVGADGRLCAGLAQPGADLSKVQIERTILLLTDQRAFSNAAAKCFNPDHAIVFYDDKELPIGWVSVSLSCSSLKGRPALQGIAAPQDGVYNIAGAAIGFLKGTCNTLKLANCGKKGM